ncbi:MAG: adenylyltransferase/cytidyltransferase family protein [Parcubacteria group bacterium]|nr:adenylyltransferase/cytidyltransferase family protein [Parcubacteria group bacterium]
MGKSSNRKKTIIIAVSGGFDPVHVGHVRMFQEAKKLGGKLVVILNNDNWLRKKKGYVFMPQNERKELLEAIQCVDKVILTRHKADPDDMSVCTELEYVKPDIFANGGDRKLDNIPEVAVCNKISCKMIFSIGKGGKVQSSSLLLANFLKESLCPCGAKKEDGTSVKYKHCHGK